MKVFAILLATAGLVAAQSTLTLPAVPACASSCAGTLVSGLLTNTQGCSVNDLKCFCKTAPVQKALKECVPKQCTAKADVNVIYNLANKECEGAAGYTKLSAK